LKLTQKVDTRTRTSPWPGGRTSMTCRSSTLVGSPSAVATHASAVIDSPMPATVAGGQRSGRAGGEALAKATRRRPPRHRGAHDVALASGGRSARGDDSMDDDSTRAALEAWLRGRLGDEHLTVGEFGRPKSGFSAETLILEATVHGEPER